MRDNDGGLRPKVLKAACGDVGSHMGHLGRCLQKTQGEEVFGRFEGKKGKWKLVTQRS